MFKIIATETTREVDEHSVPVIKRERSSVSNTSSSIDFLQKKKESKKESENEFKESNMERKRSCGERAHIKPGKVHAREREKESYRRVLHRTCQQN